MRGGVWLRAGFLALLLAGCSGQEAFNDGKTLMDQGKPEESMAKFTEALRQSPNDVEYRSAYLKAQEKALFGIVERADRLTAKGAFDEARALYRHALAIDPDYGRALDGLTQLDASVHRKTLLDEAETQLARGQTDVASQKLSRLLAEAPNDPRVQALKRAIDGRQTEEPEARLAQIYRKPITIEFKDVSLKQVFEVISHTSGLNFLFDKDVKTDQHTSIFLKNSNIEAAVRFVLLTNQLEQQVMDGNTVLIYPNTAAKQKDYQELDVRTFYLANAEAKTVANTLKTILKIQNIVADEKLNMVVIRDTPDAIKMAEKLVAVEDVADPEVMLEVEVIEVARTFTQDLGVQWPGSLSVLPTPLGTAVTSGGTGSSSSGTSSSTTPANSTSLLSLHDLLHQSSNSLGVTVGGATANANLQDSNAKILTNPRIRVRNHEKAKILIGNRVPNITSTATSTGFLSQSVNYIDVGLTLSVEPTIYLDDYIGLKLALEVSSITDTITTQTGTTAYEIGTRDASTVLRLKNGETDVLAGLIDTQERTSGNKIPGFGDLPVVGKLFGATTDDDTSTEIILAITPHLVRSVERPDAANAFFKSGTENSLHSGASSGGGAVSAPSAPTAPTSAPSSPSSPSASASPASPQSGLNGTSGSGYGDSALSGSGGFVPSSGTGTDASAPVADTTAGGVPAAGIAEAQLQGNSPVAVGGIVTLNLLLQSTEGVTGLSTQLSYDPTKLQVTDIVEGPFMRQSGSTTNFSSRVGSGVVTLADSTASGAGATAQGVFATVTFRALAAAPSTSVQLQSSQALGVGNVAITLEPPAAFTMQITGS